MKIKYSARLFVLCLIIPLSSLSAVEILIISGPAPEGIEPGLHLSSYEPREDRSLEFRDRSDRGLWLASSSIPTPEETYLYSTDNQNEIWTLNVPLPRPSLQESLPVVCTQSECFVATSHGGDDKEYRFSFNLDGSIEEIAAVLQIQARKRHHPGHALETRFKPLGQDFVVGSSTLDVAVRISNVGEVPVQIARGGMYRGTSRNNRIRCSGTLGNEPLPDVGSSGHFGGLGHEETLEPGESFELEFDLLDWFELASPGVYTISCDFFAELYPEGAREGLSWPEYASLKWEEYVGGSIEVRAVERKP